MKQTIRVFQVAIALAVITVSAPASATLLVRSIYQDAALSIDACGNTPANDCTVQSDVPLGATVQAVYLYSADIWGGGLGDVTLAGNLLTSASGTLLTPDANPANTNFWDVTSFMKPIIEGGPGGVMNHSLLESVDLDGEVFVVVYSDASTVGQTAIVLDGELALGGDTTTLAFANPYAGGDLIMSLGISFGHQPSGQVSVVDVTTNSTINRRLTSCAGGEDDGLVTSANGALITAGGIGDNPANPDPNCSGEQGNFDDELYNLALGNSADANPFINIGDTFLQFDTSNPSFDDNVFFMGISSTFRINENPEPATLALLGAGLAGLGFSRRKKRE